MIHLLLVQCNLPSHHHFVRPEERVQIQLNGLIILLLIKLHVAYSFLGEKTFKQTSENKMYVLSVRQAKFCTSVSQSANLSYSILCYLTH